MKRATLAAFATFAAVAAVAATVRNATEEWTRNRISAATNAVLRQAKDYADARGGDVVSINGKTGTVVLAASDVGAWDGRYEVDSALRLGYKGRAFFGSPPYSLEWKEDEKRYRAQWRFGDVPVYDYLAYVSDLLSYVPATRKINGLPLSSDITIEGMSDNAAVLTNGALKTKGGTSITPAHIGATTPEDVTAAIREQSLGGIWDETLQVWWTPRMRNGSLTYEATTNVNLNAEN